MTHLEPTPNAAFWQALEAYIQGRIVEQAAERPAPRPVYEEAGDEAWQEYQHIKRGIFPAEVS